MPTVDLTVSAVNSVANWTPSSGTLVTAVQSPGSGDDITNLEGFTSAIDYRLNLSPIPTDATINSVTATCRVKGVNLPPPATIDGLSFAAAPGSVNTGTVAITSSYGYQFLPYPFALTRAQLALALIGLGVNDTGGSVQCDYIAATVDYTETTPYLMVWVSHWTPPGCSQPDPKTFKKLALLEPTAINPYSITAIYAKRFGQPPAGATLWLICRSINSDEQPNANSPVRSFTVP
jgi:hypothetical protein